MSTGSQLFAAPSEIGQDGAAAEPKMFGHTYRGRYHMPLLPGEKGTRSGGDWVPYGLTRVTNLASAIEDQKSLNEWEQRHIMRGLALDASLYEELAIFVRECALRGVDWENLTQEHPDVVAAMTGKPGDSRSADASLAGRAKHLSGANIARQAGTNRHTAWEARGEHGGHVGTPTMSDQVEALERLLTEYHLVRVPGLSERVIRHTGLHCAGRFDDVLRSTVTGRLYIGDLKTKRRAFKSWLTVDTQLAIYADADWMLTPARASYESGPRGKVDDQRGVVYVMPSNGDRPYLRPADLQRGLRNAYLAKQVTEERAYARSRPRHTWMDEQPW